MSEATLKMVREFFHTDARPMALADFRKEWTQGGLTEDDKREIREGIGNGTLNY